MSKPESTGSGQARFAKELLLHPLFLAVLALKLACGAFFASHFMRDWFAPFVGHFVVQGGDPWAAFQALGQDQAFPYPPGMLYLMSLPRLLLAPWVSPEVMAVDWKVLLALRLPLLVSDLAIYAVLASWFRGQIHKVRFWYWCSPVVFYVAYFHGQLDLVPTALFTLCLHQIAKRRLWLGMLLLGLALSTKNHLWIALPFLLVYLKPQAGFPRLAGLALLPLAVYAALSAPYWGSPAYQAMVLNNEQQGWIFLLAVPVGKWNAAFLVCPAALLFVFAKYVGYPRQNWDLTLLFLGLAFVVFVVLVPPMPGWYIWSMPFLIYYLCRFQRGGVPLMLLFSGAYAAYFLLGQRSDLFEAMGMAQPASGFLSRIGAGVPDALNNLAFTAMQCGLAALAMVMYTTGVRSNEVYSARRKPLMIGIAGDSGAGKDRLAQALSGLLGEGDVIRLDGDDYHRWERGDHNWELLTHLNPRGNRLHEQLDHMVALSAGRGISKAAYDHSSGRFTNSRPVDPRKHILVQGLHSFLLEQQRRLFDLKVFLDPEEPLRVFWKLRRDSLDRGHPKGKVLEALKKRAKDRAAAVLPQRNHADMVFRLRPLTPKALADLSSDPALYLEVRAGNSYNLQDLGEALREVPGVEAVLSYPKGLSKVVLMVKGRISSEDLNRLAPRLLPALPELLGIQPRFPGSLEGVMLMCVMIALSANLKFGKGSNS